MKGEGNSVAEGEEEDNYSHEEVMEDKKCC